MMVRKRRPDESKEDYDAMVSRALKAWREFTFNRKDQEAAPPVEKSTPIQRIRDLANITYLDPETGRRSGDRPVLPTGLNAFLPVGARPTSAGDLSSLSVNMRPNPFSDEILRGLAFNPEGEEMENMMGFRPLRYANGTGPQGVTMEDAAPQAMDSETRAATIEYIATSLGMDPDSLMGLNDKQLMAAKAKVDADMMAAQQQQMNMMAAPGDAGVSNSDLQMRMNQANKLAELEAMMSQPNTTGFLAGPYESSMSSRFGPGNVGETRGFTTEGLGMGVTQNPGFDPQMQTYSPPERRANGGIMSLRVR